MSKSGFKMDFSDFDKKTTRIIERIVPERASEGQAQAAEQWKQDADNISPKTPVKSGKLKASGKVSKTRKDGKTISTEVSYNTSYAARVHEAEPGTIKFTEPGAGPKFLESKAVRFAKKYTSIVALNIRRK